MVEENGKFAEYVRETRIFDIHFGQNYTKNDHQFVIIHTSL